MEKRLQSIRTNQELAQKLTEKSDTILDFTQKAGVLIDSDRMPANPDELADLVKKFEHLEIEHDDLQVCAKMVTDWSSEISRGPNPSRSVDQAESVISEQLAITSRGVKSKRSIYESLYENWLQLNLAFEGVEKRADMIGQLTADYTASPNNQDIIHQLDELCSADTISGDLEQVRELNSIFMDGQIMTEFLEEKTKSIVARITNATEAAAEAKKAAEEELDQSQIEQVNEWVTSTERIVENASTVDELRSISDQLQQHANDMIATEKIQEKLSHLDSKIRERRQKLDDINVVSSELKTHRAVLVAMKEERLSACDRPAEYQVALNALESVPEGQARELDEYKSLQADVTELRLPHGTSERLDAVRSKLDAAELELSTTEVHTVALSGDTIEEARNAVIRIYQELVEVKTNLEGLIKTKRELQRHNFIEAESDFSLNLVALRERFNTVGDRITQNKATLSKSLRRTQKLKRAVDKTDQWATEVLNHGVEQYTMEQRLKIASDAETRRREVREATDDCVNKIANQLGANTDQLQNDVSGGLQSTERLVNAMKGAEEESSTDFSSVSSSSSSSSSSSGSEASSSEEESPPSDKPENKPIKPSRPLKVTLMAATVVV